jgi:hypothetical protein
MRFNAITIGLMAVILAGCAGSGGNGPVDPVSPAINSPAISTNHHLWGLWEVSISSDRRIVEFVPARSGEMHLNVVRLLEVTPCDHCLTITNLQITGPNELQADLTLSHPFPGLLKYTGFDVRGIFIAQTDFTFPVSGRKIAWGEGVPRMLNPDGYTPLFNPTEFPPANPPALGYIPGKHSTGGDLNATLNAFVAYKKEAPRRMFEAGSAEIRTVQIYAPTGPIHFGYAVDVSWQLVDDVIDPLTDFPPDANCLEPYRLDVSIGANLHSEPGSQVPIQVEIYDHQGLETISTVTIEAPDLFADEISLSFSTVMPDDGFIFAGTLTNDLGAADGKYPLLVRATDWQNDQNLGPTAAWQVCAAKVGLLKGWAKTWGSDDVDWGYSVALDSSGNVYVTGMFAGAVDFDPGPGVDNHISNEYGDAFLSKFDSSGNFQWARTWGGIYADWGEGVAVDGSGNVYVTGYFTGTADFDPGPGVDNHTSNGSYEVFLSKFDSSGNFLWAKTWGGADWEEGYGVVVDGPGSVYVTGYFFYTVDFDPGSGLDNHTSNGYHDVFLSKFDSSGNFLWAKTWGGSDDDLGFCVAVDGSGNACVTGCFQGTIDFDPDATGVDNHTSNGDYDAFLSKFDSLGNFQWAKTWGGIGWDAGYGVAVDGTGNACVTGWFKGAVDFDPGPGVDNHTSNGDYDIFLSKFDSSGNFQSAGTWGGSSFDIGYGVAVDGTGNTYVTGVFSATVDFDPAAAGIDNHISNGYIDVFLSKFDSSGNFKWAKTWGGIYYDYGLDVAMEGSGNAYVTGFFSDTVDFNPGSAMDNHVSSGYDDVFLTKFPPDGNW